MRRFFVDKIENMRDIGGYYISNNKTVKSGKIIRTNLITQLEEKDIKKIKDMGFSTVIDLRSDEEIKRKKGIFADDKDFTFKHICIKGNGRLPERENTIIDTYMEMLEGKDQIKEIFETLCESKGGIIYYCNAGKDRTGVVTALILKLLGVDEQDIILDYVASGIYLENMLNNYAKEMNNENILKIITPKKETMYKLLNNIKNQYGSVEGYLKDCNITNEQIKLIKQKYIEEI